MNNKNNSLKKTRSFWYRFGQSERLISFSSTLVSVLAGLFVCLVFLLITDSSSSFVALGTILGSGFSGTDSISKFIYGSAPILMLGLAFSFTYKAGLFNFGTPGQYVAGACIAIVAATLWNSPWYVSVILALFVGGIVGIIPGLLKAYFNVNEIISSLLLDWVALIVTFLCLTNISLADLVISAGGVMTNFGLNIGEGFSVSIIIAVVVAVGVYMFLEKTAGGFELQAFGSNKLAAKYIGVSSKKQIIIAFVVSGAFAGIAGAFTYLAPGAEVYQPQLIRLPSLPFAGIAVSLLAMGNPLGCIFAALLISYINVSIPAMSSLGFSQDNATIIIGIIIYSSAFINLTKTWVRALNKKHFFLWVKNSVTNFNAKAYKALTGVTKDKNRKDPLEDEIVEIANSSMGNIKYNKNSEVTTNFIKHKDIEEESEVIEIDLSPAAKDLETYKANDLANDDISELKRNDPKNKGGK